MKNRWFSFSRHTNSQSSTEEIYVLGYTGSNASGLTTKLQSALRAAVVKCNAIHTDINFKLSYGADYQQNNIVVYRVNNSLPGAKILGDIPEGNRPNKWIQINSGIEGLNACAIEFVLSREIRNSLEIKRKNKYWQLLNTVLPLKEAVTVAKADPKDDLEFNFYDRVVREYLY